MTAKTKTQNFEETFSALQQIAEKLESENISLDDALQAYQEGIRLIRQCTAILEQAQLRIEQLSRDESGQIRLEEFGESMKE